jgi:hypothetical protein
MSERKHEAITKTKRLPPDVIAELSTVMEVDAKAT